jgi:hypothetical protein
LEDDATPDPDEIDVLRRGGEAALLKAVLNPPTAEAGDVQATRQLWGDSGAGPAPHQDVELCPGTAVLNVYDLNEDVRKANKVLADGMSMGGVFHVGVEVFGTEWCYGCLGVCATLPRAAEGHVYHCSIPLGRSRLGRPRLVAVLYKMCLEWSGASYHIIGRNCCGFAVELCQRLGVRPPPAWVNRLPRMLHAGHEVSEVARKAAVQLCKAVQQDAVDLAKDAVRELERQALSLTRRLQVFEGDHSGGQISEDPCRSPQDSDGDSTDDSLSGTEAAPHRPRHRVGGAVIRAVLPAVLVKPHRRGGGFNAAVRPLRDISLDALLVPKQDSFTVRSDTGQPPPNLGFHEDPSASDGDPDIDLDEEV